MKTDKLLKLVELLRKIPEESFDYCVVGSIRSCGTVACAIGHLPMLYPYDYELVTYDGYTNNLQVATSNPKRIMEYDEAAEHAFGIAPELARYMFLPEAYVDDLRIHFPSFVEWVEDKYPVSPDGESTSKDVASFLEYIAKGYDNKEFTL